MRYRGFTLFLLIVGVYMITTSVMKESYTCADQKIIYRYLPKSFAEEQSEPVLVSEIFKKMFNLPSPWISSIGTYDRKKQDQINKYFISQA